MAAGWVSIFLSTIYRHHLILYYLFVLEDPVMGCNISTVFFPFKRFRDYLQMEATAVQKNSYSP